MKNKKSKKIYDYNKIDLYKSQKIKYPSNINSNKYNNLSYNSHQSKDNLHNNNFDFDFDFDF